MCDYVLILQSGEVGFKGTFNELNSKYGHGLFVNVESPAGSEEI